MGQEEKKGSRIFVDGTEVELQDPDFDQDGNVGGVETVTKRLSDEVIPVAQPTEVGEVMRTMFPAENVNNTKMLGNISPNEEPYILAFLILSQMGVTPKSARDMVLEKLMLTVSRNARGRDDGKEIMIGKKEQDIKMGAMGRMGEGVKGFFGMGRG